MLNAFNNPQVIEFCADQKLLENLRECNKLLEQVKDKIEMPFFVSNEVKEFAWKIEILFTWLLYSVSQTYLFWINL